MSVSSRRTLAQLNYLLTCVIAPWPLPLLCVYTLNPFLQQMTGSPTEPVWRFQLSCITMLGASHHAAREGGQSGGGPAQHATTASEAQR